MLQTKHHLLPMVTLQYQKDERCELSLHKKLPKTTERKNKKIFRMETLSTMHKLVRSSFTQLNFISKPVLTGAQYFRFQLKMDGSSDK